MKELGTWIPQIFYDLIGRVAPGTFLLLLGMGLLVDPRRLAELVAAAKGLPTSEVLLVGLTASYMLGLLLGSLSLLLADDDLFLDARFITAEIPTRLNASVMSRGQVSFLYDALQYFNPAAGARLAKLRAEQHLCRVLLMGVALLIPSYLVTHWRSPLAERSSVLAGLLGMALAARAFFLHLEVRSSRLRMNYCQLLAELRQVEAPPAEPVTELGATEHQRPTAAQRLRRLIGWGHRTPAR
jgi:hypothetical protein